MPKLSRNSENSRAADKILAAAERLREQSSYQQALRLSLTALKLFKKSSDQEGIIRCLLAAGDVCRMIGDFDQSITCYEQVITLAETGGDAVIAADARVGLGLALRGQGKWKDALRHIRRSKRFYMKEKDKQGIAFALWAEAGAYRIQGDIAQTLRLFKESYRMFRSLGDTHGLGYCLCGLGGASRIAGKFRNSLRFYKEANAVFTGLKDTFGRAYSFCGIGNAYRMLQDYPHAFTHFSKAVRLYKKIGDRVSYSYTLWGLATAYKMTGDYQKAVSFFKESLKLFRKTKDPRGVIYCKLGLGEVALLKKNISRARTSLSSALEESLAHHFALEYCYAKILSSVMDGKNFPVCYNTIGLKLSSGGIPFNIP